MGEVTGLPWKGRAYLRSKYPGVFPLSECQFDILKGIAKARGPTNAYRLAKSIGRAYSFVFNSLKELERRRLVMFKGEVKTEKRTTAKNYDLTLAGVLILLQKEMQAPETRNRGFIKKIMKKYSTLLPLVFGKRNYFEEAGLGKIFRTRLKFIVNMHKKNRFGRGTGFYPWLETNEQITRFFYISDYIRLETWLTALKQDTAIRNYVIKELKYEQRRIENMRDRVKDILLFIESDKQLEKSP